MLSRTNKQRRYCGDQRSNEHRDETGQKRDMMEKTVESCDLWAVAYALTRGVTVARVRGDRWVTFVLNDTNGSATNALREWYRGTALVHAREYAAQYRAVQRLTRAS